MRTIYIDSDFKCHVTDDGTMTEIQTDYFNGKCDALIEGYRFVPSGEIWTRSDGEVFQGEMIAPWEPYDQLDNAQREYERKLLAEYEAALANSVPLSTLEESYREGVNSAYES